MNYHPLFVHFPIALLSIYALCELLRFKKIKEHGAWFYVKAVLLITGTAGATAAILTGDGARAAIFSGMVSPAVTNPRAVIAMHETWAKAGSLIFLVLAVGYAIVWLEKLGFEKGLRNSAILKKIWGLLLAVAKVFTDAPLVIILAVLGTVAITIAGSLGGAIVYGPNTDPIVHLIYNLFFH